MRSRTLWKINFSAGAATPFMVPALGLGVCAVSIQYPQLYYASFCVFPHLADLVWQVRTNLFTPPQVKMVTDTLISAYCEGKSLIVSLKLNTTCTKIYIWYKRFLIYLQNFSYTMSVLYPECLIRIIMEFYIIPYNEVILKVCLFKHTYIVLFLLRQRKRCYL